MKLIRIVLADDQILIRTGVRTVLGVFQDLKIVGEAGTTPKALRLVQDFQPDILLMDIAMEAGEGHNSFQGHHFSNRTVIDHSSLD